MLPEVKADTDVYNLSELRDSSAEDLAERLKQGHFDIVVDGALCEWGSPLEDVLRKLENSVMAWREDGTTKSILIRFVEADKEEEPLQEKDSEDIIRLDSN